MIAETAAAQEEMVAEQQAARDKRDKAVRTASTALTKAMNADAASRAVEADFQARLLKDFQDAEAEKAAVCENACGATSRRWGVNADSAAATGELSRTLGR